MLKKMLIVLFVSLSILAMATATLAQGRKMGLFVGINEYQGGISSLKSCVNDAVNMQTKLTRKYGFEASNLLKDAEATRQNILDKLDYYERQAKKGDLFVFYYSGHGSVFPDADSVIADETEQFGMPNYFPTGYYDSALVPVDAKSTTSGKAWKNFILDDELNEIFSRFTAKGVQVIFISDSCHSGTLAKGLDLEKNKEYKFVAPKAVGFDTNDWSRAASIRGRKSIKNFNKLFLVIGSSQDNQFSRAGGPQDMSLFTKIFLAKIDEYALNNKTFTYQSILDSVKSEVDRRSYRQQTPRLDDRFFEPSLLNNPIFSLHRNPVTAGNNIRIVAKVTDDNGNAMPDTSFGIFRVGANIGKDEIQKSDILMLGRTDEKGFFDSGTQSLKLGSNTLPLGLYQVKVVKSGYQTFIRKMEVVGGKNNIQVFIFKLVKE